MEEQSLNEVSHVPTPKPATGKVGLLSKLIATGLGTGLSPIAPGTVGSLLGLLVYAITDFEKPYLIGPAIVVFFFWGAYAAGKMEKVYGHDPSRVVIDEIVAMWISLAFLPKRLFLMIVGFFIFRMLDIFKPFPSGYIDRKNGGFAIMLDDVFCGVYTNLIIRLYLFLGQR